MVFGSREVARRGQGRTEVRAEALRSRVVLSDLATPDGHLLNLTFSCSVQALDQPVERQMLTETFLTANVAVTADEVMAHFFPALRSGAARVIGRQPAEHWMSAAVRTELVDALRAAARPVAFSCGIELVAPFDVAIESPTLQREKIESMQRQLTERRTASQAEHMARSAELLRQFQALREAAPGLSPGKVLERISPADRGSMLETLIMASASQAHQALYAVAGPNLVRIDPRQSPPGVEVIPLPGDLGPLRSVQAGEVAGTPGLLVGAQAGVLFVDPARFGAPSRYAGGEVASPLGFNSVVALSEWIWATHGEAGVVAWRTGALEQPAFTVRPEQAGQSPRNATLLDHQRILYSAGGTLNVADASGRGVSAVASGNAAIVAIVPDNGVVSLVRANGQVERLDRSTFEPLDIEHRSGEIVSAGELPWLGSRRLLLGTAEGPVLCVGADDALVTQYASPHRGLRAIAAAADVVAGLSADRTRLILWKSWDGRKPAAEIHLAGVARHRAADLCFA